MAQVTVRKIGEGPSHLVLRIDLLSDGTGELKNYVILSPSDLTPVLLSDVPTFTLMQTWYGLSGFDVTLKVGTLAPTPLWTLTKASSNHVDFRHFGGLADSVVYTSPLADDDGRLSISTSNFNSAGSIGTIVLELRKTSVAMA
jgi:hypothetical protein